MGSKNRTSLREANRIVQELHPGKGEQILQVPAPASPSNRNRSSYTDLFIQANWEHVTFSERINHSDKLCGEQGLEAHFRFSTGHPKSELDGRFVG